MTEKRIREFIAREPRSAEAMWLGLIPLNSRAGDNPGELKRTFGSFSFVVDLAIFNVGGNKFRITVFVHYPKQIVYVKKIGTHEE